MSQQIHPKIRPCNAQRNGEQPKNYTTDSIQTSVSMLNDKVYDSKISKIRGGGGGGGIMVCLEGLAEESLFSLKKTWHHGLGLQSCI